MATSIATLLTQPLPRPALERTRQRARQALSVDPGDVAYVLAVCYHAAVSAEFAALQSDVLYLTPPGTPSPYDADTRRSIQDAYARLFTPAAASDLQAIFLEVQSLGVGGELAQFLRCYLDSTSPQQAIAAVCHALLFAARLKENS